MVLLSQWACNPGTRDPELSKKLVAPGTALPLAIYNNTRGGLRGEGGRKGNLADGGTKEPKKTFLLLLISLSLQIVAGSLLWVCMSHLVTVYRSQI